jgi:hypothetical protein
MYENLLKSIDTRRSVRSYINKEIEQETQDKLNSLIAEVNGDNSFRFELVVNSSSAFADMKKTYGVFNGVKNYISIIVKDGNKEALEKVGYYGEKLVLEATALGLGSCWVYLSFDKENVGSKIAEDEKLIGVITLGYNLEEFSEGEKKVYDTIGSRNKKPVEYFYKSNEEVPDWFIKGVTAVSKAPTGANAQPVVFHYDNGKVTASIEREAHTAEADLGITKFHFTVGAGNGTWNFGNNAEYHRD